MADEYTFTNGVNVTRLVETVDALEREPGLGSFRFRLHNEWVYGDHAFSIIKEFCGVGQEDSSRKYPFVLHADEPDVLLGTNHGPNPVEFVLHALASCVGTAIVLHAAAEGVKIDKLEFDVEGDIDVRGVTGVDSSVRNGFSNIRMHCRITADAPDNKLQELVSNGPKFSPVYDIVTNGVPVTIELEGQEVKASM